MKAILALSARHNAILRANMGASSEADSSLAVQYYYETLHYISNALQYNSYTHSEELLGTARKYTARASPTVGTPWLTCSEKWSSRPMRCWMSPTATGSDI